MFLVDGKFNNPIPVGGMLLDVLMHEHSEIIKKEINNKTVLFTGAKKDLSGGLFLMKAESYEAIEEFIKCDPLYAKNIQSYKITEFKCKEVSKDFDDWFKK